MPIPTPHISAKLGDFFEWGGSYTPDTPNNNTPLPNFDK